MRMILVPVHGHIEDAGVVVEHVLDAVAVVHIPVEDHDALHALHLDGVLGGDRHVVEDAEATGLVLLGVVARRPDDGGAASELPSRLERCRDISFTR